MASKCKYMQCLNQTTESEMIVMQQTFRITDEDGIHARPATALVNTANKFKGAESFAEANGKK